MDDMTKLLNEFYKNLGLNVNNLGNTILEGLSGNNSESEIRKKIFDQLIARLDNCTKYYSIDDQIPGNGEVFLVDDVYKIVCDVKNGNNERLDDIDIIEEAEVRPIE